MKKENINQIDCSAFPAIGDIIKIFLEINDILTIKLEEASIISYKTKITPSIREQQIFVHLSSTLLNIKQLLIINMSEVFEFIEHMKYNSNSKAENTEIH